MGANAQIEVPAFVANQVLTAAEMTQINTGIPVFATTTTRDAAFGGSGEKVLAEGQFAYIEATNTTQYYDGAAWQPVGASGLVYLNGGTVTSQTTFSLPNSTFTSAYRNYKFVFQTTSNAASQTVTMRMRASGTDNTATSYTFSCVGVSDGGSANNQTSSAANAFNVWANAANADNLGSLSLDIISPQEATRTFIQGSTYIVYSGVGRIGQAYNAMFDNTTQFDALTIISTATNNLNGVWRVYGYANS